MKTPLETRGSRANDGRSARLGKKQPDGTHAHRIAHVPRVRPACAIVARRAGGWAGAGCSRPAAARRGIGGRRRHRGGSSCARGYQRVSPFPLTGSRAAPIPTEGSSGVTEGNGRSGGSWRAGRDHRDSVPLPRRAGSRRIPRARRDRTADVPAGESPARAPLRAATLDDWAAAGNRRVTGSPATPRVLRGPSSVRVALYGFFTGESHSHGIQELVGAGSDVRGDRG